MVKAKIVSSGSERSRKIEEELIRILKSKGIEIDGNNPDVVFVVGGDGTLIRAIKLGKPIIGIKAGRKAYLLDVEAEQLEEVVERLLNLNYSIEEFPLLEYELNGVRGLAFNEVGIVYEKPQTILGNIIVNNDKILSFEGDGVIVSTPQGNWAWSFYITSTVVYKILPIIQLTILNPVKSNLRSIIFPSDVEIKITLEEKGRPQIVRVISDGEIINSVLVSRDRFLKVNVSKNHKGIIYRFNQINVFKELVCKE
ncbi:MAG: NAD(+)/NADH kinase [Sulfolobaceae archaeon]